MTQFVLAVSKTHNTSLVPISRSRNDFLLEIASKLFPDLPLEDVYVIDVNEKDMDALMLDAQKLVVESSRFEQTELFKIMEKVAPSVDELVFWYGSEHEDLDYVYGAPALLSKLKEAVSESTCELYVHYKQTK